MLDCRAGQLGGVFPCKPADQYQLRTPRRHDGSLVVLVPALEMGWYQQAVMSYTEQEDYDTMKTYIALTDKTRKKLMETNF